MNKNSNSFLVFKKFFSYYIPYYKLFLLDIFCALIQSITLLSLPLLISYITKNILIEKTVNQIYFWHI